MRNWIKKMENVFAAVAFAEAGCPEWAGEFLGKDKIQKESKSLETFLENVGLAGVRFSYVTARI
ncbi:MAG: hypothetical protein SV062_09125 [Thermodesulfobacteriota bacterium]|nr:hypothetical protein [Thermodesulfobacteriota bacterium]